MLLNMKNRHPTFPNFIYYTTIREKILIGNKFDIAHRENLIKILFDVSHVLTLTDHITE